MTEDRLVADGWMQERPCHVTIDAGTFMSVARPDIVLGLPESRPGRQRVLQVGSGRTIPVVKDVLVELNLGQQVLKIWVFVADITDEFIMGLDILRAYEDSVDVRLHVLLLGQEEVPVRETHTTPVLALSRPTESYRNRRPVCWQCGDSGHLRRGTLGGIDQRTESTNGENRGCTGRKGGRPAACDLPERRAVAASPVDGRDRAALRREQLASDRGKDRQNRLIISAESSKRGQVWTYRSARNGGKSPKHHSDHGRSLTGTAAP
jgi:hypothetical protein